MEVIFKNMYSYELQCPGCGRQTYYEYRAMTCIRTQEEGDIERYMTEHYMTERYMTYLRVLEQVAYNNANATPIPSIANATNIDTLLMAIDKEKITIPEALQDKTALIFNNLSQSNLQQKCDEIREIITEEYWPWMAQYLVMERVSIELNFHALYSNFLDCIKLPEVNTMIIKETYRNITVLLRSEEITNFSNRSLLKNLGHWLGMLTLAKNKPILQNNIDLKSLLLEAYHKGEQELFYVVPFIAKVLENCAESLVFRPPNPWTMAIMNVLAELHQEPDLKTSLKYEIEILCKNLSIDVGKLKPVIYLRNPEKLRNLEYQLSHPNKKAESSTDNQQQSQEPIEEMIRPTTSTAMNP